MTMDEGGLIGGARCQLTWSGWKCLPLSSETNRVYVCTAVEYCSDNALWVVATRRIPLDEFSRFRGGCREAGMYRGRSFFFIGCVFSSLLKYKSKYSLVYFWLYMYIPHNIEIRLTEIHYLKNPGPLMGDALWSDFFSSKQMQPHNSCEQANSEFKYIDVMLTCTLGVSIHC